MYIQNLELISVSHILNNHINSITLNKDSDNFDLLKLKKKRCHIKRKWSGKKISIF